MLGMILIDCGDEDYLDWFNGWFCHDMVSYDIVTFDFGGFKTKNMEDKIGMIWSSIKMAIMISLVW